MSERTEKKGYFQKFGLPEFVTLAGLVSFLGSVLGEKIDQFLSGISNEDLIKIAQRIPEEAQDAGGSLPGIEVDPGEGLVGYLGELIEGLETFFESFSDLEVLINIIVFNFNDFLNDLTNLRLGEAFTEHPVGAILSAIILVLVLKILKRRFNSHDGEINGGMDFRDRYE